MIKRLACFGYGVVSYLLFLATFLYAIAFVGGFVVPHRLDGPLESSLPAALAIDTTAGVKVGGATVVKTDIAASNGTIHVIDTVLMPKM